MKALLVLIAFCAHAQIMVPVVANVVHGGGTVATPTDSPGAGTYGVAPTVTLTDATSGATICYRNDGTNPAATTPGTCDGGSTTYSTSFILGVTTTVKALGTKAGSTNSSVLSSVYTVQSALGPVDAIVPCNTSTPGTVLTTTILGNCTTGGGNINGWTSSASLSAVTIQAHQTNCTLPGSLIVNGTAYPTSSTSQSLKYDHGTASQTWRMGIPNAGNYSITVGACITFGPAALATGGLYDYMGVFEDNGGYAMFQLFDTTTYKVNIESIDTGGSLLHSTYQVITPGATYFVLLTRDSRAGTASFALYDPTSSYAQVGSTIQLTGTRTTGNINGVWWGQNEVATQAGKFSFIENEFVQFSGNSAFPIGPFTTTYASPYLVSKALGNGAGSTTTIASAATDIQATNTILAFVSSENASGTVSGVAGSGNNSAGWTHDASCVVSLATQGHAEMWYKANASASTAETFTATFGQANTFRNIVVMQVAGGNTSTPFDVCGVGTAAAGNANVTSASFTPSTATGSNFGGCYITAGQALTPGANYQLINTSTSTSVAAMERYASPNSAQTMQCVQSNTSSKWLVEFTVKK